MEQVAKIVGRFPALTKVMQGIFRQVQAKYSAGVVGVVFNDAAEMLIVEHVFHPGWSWGLPGGWLGKQESPADGLRRELLEELGLPVKILHPLLVDLGAYSAAHLDMSFLCQAVGPVTLISHELLGFQWVKPQYVPRMLPFHAASVKAALESPLSKAELLWE